MPSSKPLSATPMIDTSDMSLTSNLLTLEFSGVMVPATKIVSGLLPLLASAATSSVPVVTVTVSPPAPPVVPPPKLAKPTTVFICWQWLDTELDELALDALELTLLLDEELSGRVTSPPAGPLEPPQAVKVAASARMLEKLTAFMGFSLVATRIVGCWVCVIGGATLAPPRFHLWGQRLNADVVKGNGDVVFARCGVKAHVPGITVRCCSKVCGAVGLNKIDTILREVTLNPLVVSVIVNLNAHVIAYL